MYALASLLSGLVFGLGLMISGMVNPAKVIGAPMPDPARRKFDLRCLFGSLAFGVGWGMALFELVERMRDARGSHSPSKD